jgi:hypothetical protein
MIDRLLQSHLEPIARDYQRWYLWRGLARCWAAAGSIGLGVYLIHRFTGWSTPWPFPALVVAATAAAATVVHRFHKSPLDYRALARRIEEENPKLHALLLTAVEQQPDRTTGELNYLQQRVIDEALKHHRERPWGGRVFERLFFAQCAHWLAFSFLLLVLAGLRPIMPTVHGFLATRSHGVAVTPGDTSLERGSGLVVLARFDGRLPAEATLVVKPVNENERRIPLMKNLDDPVFGAGITEVNSDLTYRIEFSSGRTRDFKVTVFDYPRLEHADAKVTYPRYTGLPEKTIQDTRRVSAVEGSSLDYSFFLNKPVASARLVTRDKTVVHLGGDTNNPSVYHTRFTLDQSQRYELVLVDDAGRTNKVPPEFVIEMLKNRPPELKLTFPRGDQRVSPLEEIAFQAEASDDFGLRSYGVAYTLAGKEPKVIELGQSSNAHEKRPFNYLLPLEDLAAQTDQLLSYYVWADDIGPDGSLRRVTSDMFFAEIRPFDEIFREGQSMEGEGGGGGQQGGGRAQKLAELQKQIINATWNLQRQEGGAANTTRR